MADDTDFSSFPTTKQTGLPDREATLPGTILERNYSTPQDPNQADWMGANHAYQNLLTDKGTGSKALDIGALLAAGILPVMGARGGRGGPKSTQGAAGETAGKVPAAPSVPERGGIPRGNFELPPSSRSHDPYVAIPNQPSTVKLPGVAGSDWGEIEARPIPQVQAAVKSYMEKAGRPPVELAEAPRYDVSMGRRIAAAYDAMQHNPHDPAVKAAYESLIEETVKQYLELKRQGFDFKFNEPGEDPYARSPSLGYLDARRGHLSIFPTLEGFGSGANLSPEEVANNPLLKDTGLMFGDKPATANDIFRVVHDLYGHFGPGNPFFRGPGEERAWSHHAIVYPEPGRGAATSELRGQNNWLNLGPHAEHNKNASGADTIYADQKSGLMPGWTWDIGHLKTKPIEEKRHGGETQREGYAEAGGVGDDPVGSVLAQYDPDATINTQDIVQHYPPEDPFHGGIKGMLAPYMPESPEWWKTARGYIGKALNNPDLAPAWTAAAFIGPGGAGRLQAANLLHPDDPGGLNRLAYAQSRPKWVSRDPEEQAEILQKTGWSPPQTFGTRGVDISKAQPMTWLGTPDFQLTNPFGSGAGHQLADVTEGLQKLFVAEPQLPNLPTDLSINPHLIAGEGATEMGAYRRGQPISNIGRLFGTTPDEWRPVSLKAIGKDPQDLKDITSHEIAHATMVPQGVAFPASNYNENMMVLRGSEAERYYDAATTYADIAYRNAVNRFGKQSQQALEAFDNKKEIEDLLKRTPKNAGYLASAQERGARATKILGPATLEQMMKNREMAPSLIDTYQPGALGRYFERALGDVPLKLFKPPQP